MRECIIPTLGAFLTCTEMSGSGSTIGRQIIPVVLRSTPRVRRRARIGSGEVVHGDGGTDLRSAKCNNNTPGLRNYALGFRVGFQVMSADTANPEIFLEGNTTLSHSQGLPFSDPGVEAHDARDGNITDQIVVTGNVDMNSTGTYLLTYTVQDGAGNTATATRTVR